MVESELERQTGVEGSVFPEPVSEGGGRGQTLTLSTQHLLHVSLGKVIDTGLSFILCKMSTYQCCEDKSSLYLLTISLA